jgi:transposase
LARYGLGPDRVHRFIGGLDAASGSVVYEDHTRITRWRVADFFAQLREACGADARVCVIWDNWPVHEHEEVRQAAAQHQIGLQPLPTYAPWLNPIEKLWRLTKQTVGHLHDRATQWPLLIEDTRQLLNAFADPSPQLLRYVGLCPD